MKIKPVSMNCGVTAGLVLLTVSLLAFKGFSQDPDFYIFLAFGQSNMEGYPGTEAGYKDGIDDRFQLLPAVDWPDKSRTKGTWTTAVPPLCRSNTGLCPADFCGRTLVDSLPENIKIGIINVSVAGCSIKMFDKNNYQSYISTQQDWMKNIAKEYGGNPYGRLVEMGKLAQKDGVIKGFLLHQGETDAGDGQWGAKVKGVYDNLIADLGLDASKTPLLAGDLVSPNTNIQKLPNFLPNSYVISSQGCGHQADNLHFNGKGYELIGTRYGLKMLELIGKTGVAKSGSKIGSTFMNCLDFRNGIGFLTFEIPKSEFITLKAYTLGGKEIADLANAEYTAGRHTLKFGQKMMPSGVFVLRMESESFSATRTILVSEK